MEDVLGKPPAPPPPTPPPAEKPAAPEAAPPAEPVAVETPPEVPEAPPPEEIEDEKQNRFRFKDDEDRAIALIAKTRKISLREATKLYEGTAPQSAPASTPAAPPPPVPAPLPPEIATIDQQATAVKTQITGLTEKRNKARSEVDHEEADKFQDEINAANAVLVDLTTRKTIITREHESRQQNAYVEKATASAERVYAKFEKLADPASIERLAFDTFVARTPQNDPLFDSPSWPEVLAERFAAAHPTLVGKAAPGGPPAPKPAASAPKPPTPKPVATQVPNAKLISGADGSHPSPSRPPLTGEAAIASVREMTAEQRLKLIDAL